MLSLHGPGTMEYYILYCFFGSKLTSHNMNRLWLWTNKNNIIVSFCFSAKSAFSETITRMNGIYTKLFTSIILSLINTIDLRCFTSNCFISKFYMRFHQS
jgi:hypothetical protein